MTALTILHTNDIHGRVDQLARIATLARRIRDQAATRGGDCLLCDAGDVEDPTLLESNMTKGSAAYAVLRAAGYDLAAPLDASEDRQCRAGDRNRRNEHRWSGWSGGETGPGAARPRRLPVCPKGAIIGRRLAS